MTTIERTADIRERPLRSLAGEARPDRPCRRGFTADRSRRRGRGHAACVFAGAAEYVITGSALLAFAAGWAMLAVLSTRLTSQPQRWAYVPAAVDGRHRRSACSPSHPATPR